MRPIKHILVIVDPASVQHPCVEKGARIARATGATLELFVCDYHSELLSSRFAQDDVLQLAVTRRRAALDTLLRQIAAPLRTSGVKVLTDMSFQQPLHLGVVGKALACDADLVIKDTHYHSAAHRAFFTNTDWHLIRECPVPLLLAKPSPWSARLRMAAAIDPAHADDKPAALDRELLDAAEYLALSLNGEALAVHAFDAFALLAGTATTSNAMAGAPLVDMELVNTLRQYHDEEFRALLVGRAAFVGHADLVDGAPFAVLPDYAARKAVDVLVVGAVSRSVVRRLLIGSTAERLLDQLPCDILVVKPAHAA